MQWFGSFLLLRGSPPTKFADRIMCDGCMRQRDLAEADAAGPTLFTVTPDVVSPRNARLEAPQGPYPLHWSRRGRR